MVTAPVAQLDPIKYEVFTHRLWAIGEEGRIALQRVSASPIVVQGGECMSSFYAPDGTMILACSGHLRFAAATSDAIRRVVEWYGESPGFFEGDQIFFNDPYVAGAHTYDQMIIMPIYHEGELLAWAASSTHTADVGGPLRGGATEIFHEGIRILGLKVVEQGEFRHDVFKTITEQCRDPHYVGLDIKARIAANNVCAERYLDLVRKLGKDFVVRAGQKLIEDAERMARDRLRSIPDGTWTARCYGTRPHRSRRGEAEVYQVVTRLTKRDDELEIDFEGTSDQSAGDLNSSLPNTVAHVSIALTNTLLWNVPLSDGRLAPLSIKVPEGSILHCRYPASCGHGPRVGNAIVSSINDCLAKMLFAAGQVDDVNATWSGHWTAGGAGSFYGGHNREGIPVAQGLYDIHGSGLGAGPARDGVNTGGHQNIPSGGISDIEITEMQYPFLYFTRSHLPDGGGFGRWQGGAGSRRVYKVYGSNDLSVDYKPFGGAPEFAFGLFGGYPVGPGGERLLIEPPADVMARLRSEAYPIDEDSARDWGELRLPKVAPHRVPVPDGWIATDFSYCGGGYGDPLDREPERVAQSVREGLSTRRNAEAVYGVVFGGRGNIEAVATAEKRRQIREERLSAAQQGGEAVPARGDFSGGEGVPARGVHGGPPHPESSTGGHGGLGHQDVADWQRVLRFHEYLDLVKAGGEFGVRCRRCGTVLCRGDENYKTHAIQRERKLEELTGRSLPTGEPYRGVYQEYYCPGCATQLAVDVRCPEMSGPEPVWDIRLDLAQFR